MNDDQILDVIGRALDEAMDGRVRPITTDWRILAALRAAGLEVVDVSDERHEIEFSDKGWVIAHPIKERLDGSLFDCPAWWDAGDPGIRGRRELVYSDTLGCWAVHAHITKKEQR